MINTKLVFLQCSQAVPIDDLINDTYCLPFRISLFVYPFIFSFLFIQGLVLLSSRLILCEYYFFFLFFFHLIWKEKLFLIQNWDEIFWIICVHKDYFFILQRKSSIFTILKFFFFFFLKKRNTFNKKYCYWLFYLWGEKFEKKIKRFQHLVKSATTESESTSL